MLNNLEVLTEEDLKNYYNQSLKSFKFLVESLNESEVQINLKKLIPYIEERCNSVTALKISREIGYIANDETKEELYRNLKSLHAYRI